MIKLSEISQTEKDKCLYAESKKKREIQMKLLTKQKTLADLENKPMVTKGER